MPNFHLGPIDPDSSGVVVRGIPADVKKDCSTGLTPIGEKAVARKTAIKAHSPLSPQPVISPPCSTINSCPPANAPYSPLSTRSFYSDANRLAPQTRLLRTFLYTFPFTIPVLFFIYAFTPRLLAAAAPDRLEGPGGPTKRKCLSREAPTPPSRRLTCRDWPAP